MDNLGRRNRIDFMGRLGMGMDRNGSIRWVVRGEENVGRYSQIWEPVWKLSAVKTSENL